MKELDQFLAKMRTADPRAICAAMGVLVLLILAVDFFLILQPQAKGLLSQNSKNAELAGQIEKLKNDKQHVNQFKKGLADMKAKAADFERMVYAKEDVPLALKNISSFANEYGVKLDQMVPQRQSEEQLVKSSGGVYKSVAILVTARCGYHEFGRFLSRLENEKVFWKLDELNFSSDELNPQKHLVKMMLRIVIIDK